MVLTIFKYKGVDGEWKTCSCPAKNIEECKRICGLNPNCECEILEMRLRNGLQLFVADIVNDADGYQIFLFVTGRTYQSALKKMIKEANSRFYRYSYYFYEADVEDIQEFLETHENIKAGTYGRDRRTV